MAISRCPHCNLPLTDEEASANRCPTCGNELWEEVAPGALEPQGRSTSAGRTMKSLLLAAGWLTVLILGAGLGWFGRAAWDMHYPEPDQTANLKPGQQEPGQPTTASAGPTKPGPRTEVRLAFS